jgi:hypothetical protein
MPVSLPSPPMSLIATFLADENAENALAVPVGSAPTIWLVGLR